MKRWETDSRVNSIARKTGEYVLTKRVENYSDPTWHFSGFAQEMNQACKTDLFHWRNVNQLLGEINMIRGKNKPMLTSIVRYKADPQIVPEGFISCAKEIGRFSSTKNKKTFMDEEFQEVVATIKGTT